MIFFLFVSWVALSTVISALPQSMNISTSDDSKCLALAPLTSTLMTSVNESSPNINCVNPPQGFEATFDINRQHVLHLRDVYIVGIEAMYQLSLEPWESEVSRSREFHLSPHNVWISIPLFMYTSMPYSFAVSGLYEGVLFLQRQSSTSVVYELKVDLLEGRSFFPNPVGQVRFMHSSSPHQRPNTRLSETREPGNATLRVANNNAGSYTDPDDQLFLIEWMAYGPLINVGDVYLTAFDGIAATARYPAGMGCSRIQAIASSKIVRKSPTITICSIQGAQKPLNYGYAARAIRNIIRVMEDNGWFGETTFTLVYEGERFATGSVEPYYRSTGIIMAFE